MLTAYGERSRVVEAVRLGVNEFLLKPVSTKALLARVANILTKPRRIVQKGDYYGPEPRQLSSYKPEADPGQIYMIPVDRLRPSSAFPANRVLVFSAVKLCMPARDRHGEFSRATTATAARALTEILTTTAVQPRAAAPTVPDCRACLYQAATGRVL